MFLSRNHTIEKPHPISCQCADCVIKRNYDSLKRSRSRLNAYRALASPAYMALSSPDPIMTTFELRQEMKKLAQVEKEFKVGFSEIDVTQFILKQFIRLQQQLIWLKQHFTRIQQHFI